MSAKVTPSGRGDKTYSIFDTPSGEEMSEGESDVIDKHTKEIIRMVSQVAEQCEGEQNNPRKKQLTLTMSQSGGQNIVTDVVKKRRVSVISRSASVANTGDRLTMISNEEDDKAKLLKGMQGINQQKPWYIVLPTHSAVLWWDRFVLVLLLEVYLYQPWNFSVEAGWELYAINTFVNMIFFFDCAFQFFVTKMNEDGTFHRHLREVAEDYIRSDFFIVLLVTFPYDLVTLVFTGNRWDSHGISGLILMILNCGKIYRFKISQENSKHRMIDRLGAWMHRHPMFIAGMRVLTLLIVFLLMAHWFCCMYITIGNEEKYTNRPTDSWIYAAGIQDKTFKEQYLTAFYFSVTMLTTIGYVCVCVFGWRFPLLLLSCHSFHIHISTHTNRYGDIVPVSDQEKTLWIIMAIFGAVLYAAIFGTVTTTVQKYDSMRSSLDKELQMIGTFCKTQGIPFNIESKLIRYRKHYFNATKGLEIEMIVHGLPHMLATELKMSMYKDDVLKVPFFVDCSGPFIRCLVQEIMTGMCVVGDFIIHQGDPATALYCLKRGTAAVVVFTDEGSAKCISTITSGSIFGEIGLIVPNGTRTASILAQSLCKFWSLSKQAFDLVLDDFPEYRSRIVKHTIHYLKKKREEVDRTASINIGDEKKPVPKTLSGNDILTNENNDRENNNNSSNNSSIEEENEEVSKKTLKEKRNLKKLQQQTWAKTLKQISILEGKSNSSTSTNSLTQSGISAIAESSSAMRRRTHHNNRASVSRPRLSGRNDYVEPTMSRRVSGRPDYLEPTTTRMHHNQSRHRISRIQVAQEKAQGKMYEDLEAVKSAVENIQKMVELNSNLLSKVLRHIDGDDSADDEYV